MRKIYDLISKLEKKIITKHIILKQKNDEHIFVFELLVLYLFSQKNNLTLRRP